MLMNNLDPDVAERPADLLVYGGTGKAARDSAIAASSLGSRPNSTAGCVTARPRIWSRRATGRLFPSTSKLCNTCLMPVPEDQLVRLITDVKESVEREIQNLTREMREGFAQVNTRFDTQAVRLDRHAALWQTGRRWSSRMDAWAEKVDAALETKDHEIADLRARLNKLEESKGQ
jgi:hypothetical protein